MNPSQKRKWPALSAVVLNKQAMLWVVLILSTVYLWGVADRDWIPFDEGALAHSAERVLHNEWPHRHFDDTYTGGQAWYHAMLFKIFGVDLFSLRIGLFISCLPFLAAVYLIGIRFLPIWVAGILTLLCMAWSVPNYFAGIPSWYNLFFTTFGILAILKNMESGQSRWLFLAGLCAGLSMLFKIVGIYAVAAAMLFFVYREQATVQPSKKNSSVVYPVTLLAGLALFMGCLTWLVLKFPSMASMIHFLVPGVVLSGVIAVRERRHWRQTPAGRFKNLLHMATPYLGGALLPILLLAIPYALHSDLGALWQGVFVRPQARFQTAAGGMPPLLAQLAVLPLAWLLVRPWKSTKGLGWPLGAACAVLLGLLCLGADQPVYRGIWNSVRPIIPIVTLAACPVLLGKGSSGKQILFLLVSMAAMTSLIQFPASLPIYFCYVAPLAILVIACLIFCGTPAPKPILAAVMAFYLLFAVLWLNRSYSFTLGLRRDTFVETPLGLERGHLAVAPHWVKIYQAVTEEVQKHSKPGDFIYATVDSPEIYFLSDRRNPTGTLYEVFDDDKGDPAGRTRRIQELLVRNDVKVVVVRWGGERYSGKIPPDLLDWLLQQFPNTRQMPYDYFTVLWRD